MNRWGWAVAVVMALAFVAGCGGDDDDDSGPTTITPDDDAADDDAADDDTGDDDTFPPLPDDDTGDDDTSDDDTTDDDTTDDDADDDIPFDPWVNPTTKADAFKLYYKERIGRTLKAYNRFMLVGDVVPAHTLGHTNIAKDGSDYEVQLHPVDNNWIGFSAFNAYQAYKIFRTRELALTAIRQFEGLAYAEEIQGIDGLTCREWQTGFTVTIDGPGGTVTRTLDGAPIDPAEDYSPTLEEEIINAFFSDGVYAINGEPTDHYFRIESILRPGDYAVTFVFEEMPYYLRISNCCSSYMISQLGPFEGYFWGNHNSRDNFPDFGVGYFAALEAMNDAGADADVRASAERAWAAGQRIGDRTIGEGYNLMTVGEFEPYDEDHLIVAGEIRPDGADEGPEWLGSMNSCQMSYMAKAMSADGLTSPTEPVETPGSYEIIAIKMLLEALGIPVPGNLTKTCENMDDAYIGLGWGDIYNLNILGQSLEDLMRIAVNLGGSSVADILMQIADATDQPEMAAFALVYYAQLANKGDLLQEAREALFHITELHRISAQLTLDWAQAQPVPPSNYVNEAIEELQKVAQYAHIAGVGNADYDPQGWVRAERYQDVFEDVLNRGDSTPRALWSDADLWSQILAEVNGYADRPETYDRYWDRFPTEADKPIKRNGDHYEVVNVDGDWEEIPNITHQGFGGAIYLNEIPNCAMEPTVLDCSWAVLGCERPDLDGDGDVDADDQADFDTAWTNFGEGASCDAGNSWCDGADLDQSGELDSDDDAFMTAADGCWYEI